MPIYTDDPCNDGATPFGIPLVSSIGINPKVTKAIDAATRDWLDEHPEATTTVEDNSLTNAKFMDGSVNSRVIEDESITTDDIADLAITTPKIADNAVDATKVASSAADGLRTMSTTQPGVAKVGAGLALNNGALELNGGNIASAVTAWLNTHPEATTTVQDGAVTFSKFASDVVNDGARITDAMIRGTQFPGNLFSIWSNWHDNAYVSSYGDIVENQPNYFATDFIPVTAGVEYQANHGRNHSWYDENKVFISSSSTVQIQRGITAPENAAYIRFTINKTTDGIDNPIVLYFAKKSLFDDVTTVIPNLSVDLTMGQLFDGNNVAYSKNMFLRVGYVNPSGVLVEDVNYRHTDPISIAKDTILQHNCRSIALYDMNMQFIERVLYSYSDPNDIGTYYAKNDGFIIIDTTTNNLDITHIYKISSCIATSSMFDSVAYLKDMVPVSNIAGVISHNLIDISKCINNYYISHTNGVLQLNPNYFCTIPFSVVAGSTYKCNAGRSYAWFDEDYNYISGALPPIPTSGITAPDNAHYLALSINKTSDNITSPLDWYVAESSVYDPSELHLPTSDAWCAGKKINWIGDSIVDGPDFDEVVVSNLHLVKDSEYGINGSTISLATDGTDTRHALCVRYSDMSDDADMIAVSAGTNDWMYAWAPIGTIDSTENTTFYGALKTLCEGLVNKYPQKLIFFTTPIKRGQAFASGAGGTYTPDGVPTTPFSKNKYGLTLMDYSNIIKEVCGYYSIPVLDMNRESLLDPHLVSQQNMFDNVLTHPGAVAQKIMARRVCGWITQLGYNIEGLG